jgi:hypothetical protein
VGDPIIDKTMATRIATQLGWEPKREWVALTDEEIAEVFGDYMDSLDNGEEDDNWGYERLLEAAIKEKNT